MYIDYVFLFLAASILFYCLFAGADFGAGMLQAFVGSKKSNEKKKLISHAIGPVWEANHIWLILAIVILFVGFPKAYSQLSISFHIPLSIILVGIILRGCSFTFGHYDAVQDKSQKIYSFVFIISSFITSFSIGTVAGAILLGKTSKLEPGFKANYINPWFNMFSFSIGIFTCLLFMFLAAVYLIGETQDKQLKEFCIQKSKIINFLAILSGGLVFLSAEFDGLNLIHLFFSNQVSLVLMASTTLLLFSLWYFIYRDFLQLARINVATQVSFILLGWFGLQFPTLLKSPIEDLTIYNSAAPETTIKALFFTLIFGSLLIFPALFYLMKIFKKTPSK